MPPQQSGVSRPSRDQVKQVTLKNALSSYADIAESEHYDWPLATLLPNVLAHFDLPDCYAELNSKKLRLIDPWDAKPGNKEMQRP